LSDGASVSDRRPSWISRSYQPSAMRARIFRYTIVETPMMTAHPVAEA